MDTTEEKLFDAKIQIYDLQAALKDLMSAVHYLEGQQAMPDDGYLPLLEKAQTILDKVEEN
jgi:hypothetical protein